MEIICVLPSFEHLRKECEPCIIFRETEKVVVEVQTFTVEVVLQDSHDKAFLRGKIA
jgi:hypothetical protein